MKILGKRLLVLAHDDKTTKTGIILQSSNEKTQKGEIVNIGEVTEELKVGLDVYFKRTAGTPISMGGKDYLMLKEDEVLAYGKDK